MKKHFGKITGFVILMLLAISVTFLIPSRSTQAATEGYYDTRTICLENWVNQSQLSNPYLILMVYDGSSAGYLINAGTGVAAVDCTWANAAFDEGHWVGDAAVTITGFPIYEIPALPKTYQTIRAFLFDGASPAKTDTCYDAAFYDPSTGRFYGNSTPIDSNRTRIIDR